MSPTLYCFATRAHICSHVLLLPTTVFFSLVGPGPLHEIAVSAFSRSPLGRANTFSFQYLPSTPRISPSDYPLSPYFVALAFFVSSVLSSTYVLYPPKFSIGSTSFWSSPIFFHIFSTTLSILFQLALLLFSPVQPYQLWLATSFLACSLLYIAISTWGGSTLSDGIPHDN